METLDQPDSHQPNRRRGISMPLMGTGKAEEALEERTRQLVRALQIGRATLAATTDAILVTDNGGQVTQFNERYAEFLKTPVEVLEKGDATEVWGYAARNFQRPEGFVARAEEISHSEEESFDILESPSGRMLERVSKVLQTEDGNIGRVWSFRDITDRYAAEITARRLASIVTSSDDAIISKDLHSTIMSWNAGAERIFGYTAEEMIGTSVMRLIPPERQSEELDILTRIQRGERYEHFETVRVTKEGRRIDLSITVSPIKDSTGKVVGASKIARDISAAKQAAQREAEARARAEELSQEREQLLESEREARSRAERTGRMKDEFLATLSHELRTPLNAVLGWVNILRSEKCEGAELEEGLTIIERNARAQTQIIEDLLDMSRIISGKVRLDAQKTDLAAVLNESVDTVRATAGAKGVRLDVAVDPHGSMITGDPHRMQQVFWNLLSNAIKFTPKDGTVSVALRRIESEDLEVTVTDSGEGIAVDFLPYVFDRFQQADSSSTRRHGGLGLGLAIVKQLVEMHGGRITAHSGGRGHGARFVLRLPSANTTTDGLPEKCHEQGERMRDPRSAPVALDGLHVLVVDDEPDAREFVKRLLVKCGARVSQAGSVTEALEEISVERPDVLICDIGMPGEDGYALIQRLRVDNRTRVRSIPAVALTAYAHAEDRAKVIRLGFQNHLAKPVEAGELLAIVSSLGHRDVAET